MQPCSNASCPLARLPVIPLWAESGYAHNYPSHGRTRVSRKSRRISVHLQSTRSLKAECYDALGLGICPEREDAQPLSPYLSDASRDALSESQQDSNRAPACYGCGVQIQTEWTGRAGYVTPKNLQLKRQFRQLDQLLCTRCQDMCQNRNIPAVSGLTEDVQTARQKGLVNPSEFRDIIGQVAGRSGAHFLCLDFY